MPFGVACAVVFVECDVAPIRRILEAAPGGQRQAFSDLDEETWADAARGTALLACAGFDVEVVTDRLTGRHDGSSGALDWTLAWPTYGEAAAALSESELASFEATAAAALAESDLSWWYAVNYYVATKTPEPPTHIRSARLREHGLAVPPGIGGAG